MLSNKQLRTKYQDAREILFYWYATRGVVRLREEEIQAAWVFVSDISYSCARRHYGKPQSFRSRSAVSSQSFYDVPQTQLGQKFYHFHTDRVAELIETLQKYTNIDCYIAVLVLLRDTGDVKNFSAILYILKLLNKRMKPVWWCLFNYRKFFPSREVVRHYALKGVSVPVNSAVIINKIEGYRKKYGRIFSPEEEGALCNSIRQGLLYELSKPLLNQVSLDILDMASPDVEAVSIFT
jgi:hypothetical protein